MTSISSMSDKEIEFLGVKYFRTNSGYYLSQSTSNAGRRKAKGLHVAIWEHFSGKKVPSGFLIHHKDHNRSNNSFDNLECMSQKDHAKEHGRQNAKISEKTRAAASVWHKSIKGREWHQKHAKEIWQSKVTRSANCHHCGTVFETYFPDRAMYCTTKCRQRFYHDRGLTTRQRARNAKTVSP